MTAKATPPPAAPTLSVRSLARNKATAVSYQPDAATCRAIAKELGIDALRKLRLTGDIQPEGATDWRLDAMLGATAIQSCVVTLAPVTTRIDGPVTRRFLAEMPEPEGDEVEIPADDSLEPLPEVIDLRQIVTEALALALPDYPRSDGAELGAAAFAAPGIRPLTDEEVKPFAGLAGLRDQLDPKPRK